MIPLLDRNIGISVYSTPSPGCGGRIRSDPDGFRVEEVISDAASARIKEGGRYAVYLLEKRGMDTGHAVDSVRRLTGQRLKALGLKDAHAATRQYVCSMNSGRTVPGFRSDKVSLARIGYAERPLTKRDMVGNRFSVRVSGHGGRLSDFAGSGRILNFFGYQRFGSRRAVTHIVGRDIVRGDFAGAVGHMLAFTSPYDSARNTAIRRELGGGDYGKMLPRLPPGMDIERSVVAEMARHGDPVASLRAVPVHIRRMYVQAYQSYIFNRSVSAAFEYGEDLFAPQESDVCYDAGGTIVRSGPGRRLAVPVVGYAYYKKTRFHRYISEILEREEISHRDFFVKGLQEVSAEGGFRESAVNCRDFSVSGDTVSFVLGRGSYATILLREMIKPEDPVSAGF